MTEPVVVVARSSEPLLHDDAKRNALVGVDAADDQDDRVEHKQREQHARRWKSAQPEGPERNRGDDPGHFEHEGQKVVRIDRAHDEKQGEKKHDPITMSQVAQ